MTQHVELFSCDYIGDETAVSQLNTYLTLHPNYEIDKIQYHCKNRLCYERLLVVFKVHDTHCPICGTELILNED